MIPELYKKKVLDIGCGMGQHALQYSKKGALSVLGIDISEKMLAYARKIMLPLILNTEDWLLKNWMI